MVECIVIGIIFLFLIVYFLAQDSKKDSKRERYGDAVSQLAQMSADSISGVARSITEPASKKKIRLARELLAMRNGRLYRFNSYSRPEYLEHLLTVDSKFQEALDTLQLSKERWNIIGIKLLYIGTIRQFSRDSFDYSKKNETSTRRHILTDWVSDECSQNHARAILEALEYFNIPKDDWITYGDAVVEMYNLCQDRDLEEFGDIVAILPMKNNRHLL